MPLAEQPILQVRDLARTFGGIVAVDDFNLDVQAGSIHGLIGPNGAGKTTTFNVISGFYAPIARQGHLPGRRHLGTCAPARSRSWADPHVSGHDPVSRAHRARQRAGWLSPQRRPGSSSACSAPTASAEAPRQRRPAASSSFSAWTRRAGELPPICSHGHATRPRHGGRAGGRTEAVAARRAFHRHEPGGDRHDDRARARCVTAASPSCWWSTTCRR